MLQSLEIRNYAIVDLLNIEFDSQMSVLSGETGAGKSILLGALGLALGDRADNSIVSNGAKRAEISASFGIDNLAMATQWLEEHELDAEGECILRRTVTAEGRSRAYINGNPVPLASVKALGEMLIEIHGQHAHQRLLHSDHQRQVLDQFANHPELVAEVKQSFLQYQKSGQQLKKLQDAASERADREELLSYQLDELEQLDLQKGEFTQLEQELQKLSNMTDLQGGCESSLYRLNGDELSVSTSLGRIGSEIMELSQIDPELKGVSELLESSLIQIDESITELRSYIEGLEIEPERLHWVEDRHGVVLDLARKHHVEPELLHQHFSDLRDELESLQHQQDDLEQLEKLYTQQQQAFADLCLTLGQQRQQAAAEMSRAVSENIHQLGMGEGEFQPELKSLERGTINGTEEVNFLIRTNAGQLPKPLNKIASGGELSRISLAIQVINAERQQVPTMIFDEIDVGIGGETAAIVGNKLRQLGQRTQVLCVTHQPQVAAHGNHHFYISKTSQDGVSRTRISLLNEGERVQEIARMSGGATISEQTLLHAQEMLQQGKERAA